MLNTLTVDEYPMAPGLISAVEAPPCLHLKCWFPMPPSPRGGFDSLTLSSSSQRQMTRVDTVSPAPQFVQNLSTIVAVRPHEG